MPMWLIASLISGAMAFFGPKFIGGGYAKKYTDLVAKVEKEKYQAKKTCDRRVARANKKYKRLKKSKQKKLTKLFGKLNKDAVGKELVVCMKNLETLKKNGKGIIWDYEQIIMDMEQKHWFCSWCTVREDK